MTDAPVEVGRLALFGGGKMGEAVLSGLVNAGWSASGIVVVEHVQARREELVAGYGVQAMPAREAAAWADTVVVVVKPDDVAPLLDQVSPALRPGTVVVSLAAGLTTALLQAHLPQGQPVVRVMPNTAAMVGQGMAAISAGAHASASDVVRAVAVLGAVGSTVVVPEKLQDAVTAVSGSGPAYFFLVVEAMIDAGVTLGLPRPVARQLAVQTLVGAGRLLQESGEHPVVLRENVTSPGGTTAAAVRQLEAHGLRAAFMDALDAGARRSAQLATSAGTGSAVP